MIHVTTINPSGKDSTLPPPKNFSNLPDNYSTPPEHFTTAHLGIKSLISRAPPPTKILNPTLNSQPPLKISQPVPKKISTPH